MKKRVNKILQITAFLFCLQTMLAYAQQGQDQIKQNAENVANNNQGNSKTEERQLVKEVKTIGKEITSQIQQKIQNADSALKTKNSDNKGTNISLMYTDEQLSRIQEAIDSYKNNTPLKKSLTEGEENKSGGEAEKRPVSYVYLGLILYKAPNNWSIWINDQKISYKDNKVGNEFYVKSINQNKVDIVWTMSISRWRIIANKKSSEGAPVNQNNEVEINFSLSFNQGYLIDTNTIVEGRIIPVSIANQDQNSQNQTIQ
ncbi:MAG: hypothetical protein K0R25_1360 [Rickettsiaceae bacterium]|jgi:hypothetical protein|nr:hypothetical protein [Rickettsiaceae bacterium]